MNLSILIGSAIGLGVAVLCISFSDRVEERKDMAARQIQRLDLSAFSSHPPGDVLDILFIHHSCGGQWLAAPGPSRGENCILEYDPNGGSLRAALQQTHYRVHEASYGSRLGESTDIFDWLPKFREQMGDILRCDLQDSALMGERVNRVVMFKSCFPNNAFRSEGVPPGIPGGPDLTVWNAKAAYTTLLTEFCKQPDVLFVCVTAPPLAPGEDSLPLWKWLARKLKRALKGAPFDLAATGPLARQFNDWLADTGGWLKDYPLHNVVVFDYYNILTDEGQSDFSRYATWNGADSHPSREGNQKATKAFVPFLNQAVHRAKILPQ